MRMSTSKVLLVSAALGLLPLSAAAQTDGQASDQSQRFGQMKTPEGAAQAGEDHASQSGDRQHGSGWRNDQSSTATSDDDESDDDMDPGAQNASSDGHGWNDSHGDRWRSGPADEPRRGDRWWRWHEDMRQRMGDRMRDDGDGRMRGRDGMQPGMGMGGGGMGGPGMGMGGMGMGMMGPRPAMGALFNVQVGDARVTVRCAPRENTSACVDAAVSLVNRLRAGASSAGSANPSSGSSSANPAPAPSTPKPTTP